MAWLSTSSRVVSMPGDAAGFGLWIVGTVHRPLVVWPGDAAVPTTPPILRGHLHAIPAAQGCKGPHKIEGARPVPPSEPVLSRMTRPRSTREERGRAPVLRLGRPGSRRSPAPGA